MSNKKGLLVGVIYNGGLLGCINDVRNMKECLIEHFGFLNENINVMIEDDPNSISPTASNILTALLSLIQSSKAGDVLVLYFSGHGDRVRAAPPESNNTGYIEHIVAVDGRYLKDNVFRLLADMVPNGCSFTMIADCCHSGGLIEGLTEQIGDSTKKQHQHYRFVPEFEDFSGHHSYIGVKDLDRSLCGEYELDSNIGPNITNFAGGSILISTYQSYQRAFETWYHGPGEVRGVLTNALLSIIQEKRGRVTNWELVQKISKRIEREGFDQNPGLYCSDQNARTNFLCAADLQDAESLNVQHPLGWLLIALITLLWPRMILKYLQSLQRRRNEPPQ